MTSTPAEDLVQVLPGDLPAAASAALVDDPLAALDDPDDDPSEGDPAVLRRAAHFQIYLSAGVVEAHWRLLSGNHRELGRSATPGRSAEDACLDIEGVRSRLGEARPVIRPAAGHRWEWRLVDAAGTLAVSGHAFDRKLRCVRAAEQFLVLAPTALIARNVIATGSRRGARTVRGVVRQV